ncbi:MAG: hypothetical protein R3C49_01010 [Planctomycetaceae bacterium]
MASGHHLVSMQIELNLRNVSPLVISGLKIVRKFEDVRTVFSDACEQIDGTGQGVFRVSGFGDDLWPVDLATDLPVFPEQLPGAIRALGTDMDIFSSTSTNRGSSERCISNDRARVTLLNASAFSNGVQ